MSDLTDAIRDLCDDHDELHAVLAEYGPDEDKDLRPSMITWDDPIDGWIKIDAEDGPHWVNLEHIVSLHAPKDF